MEVYVGEPQSLAARRKDGRIGINDGREKCFLQKRQFFGSCMEGKFEWKRFLVGWNSFYGITRKSGFCHNDIQAKMVQKIGSGKGQFGV